jgi:tRNA A-37 threonylcarbamoyl transferase component Bud32
MKSCPTCQRVFPNDAGFCPADGTPLAAASMAPAAPTTDDERIGTRLAGRYELRRVVADGGMGRVYEGIDKQSDSRIAVKMLHADVARDEVALARFKREYEINASLPHEHIVKVLGFDRDPISQMWILVMEFLDGEELRYVLKREKVLTPERLVRMLSQVAIGLDEAHSRGFIHRDLKPDNLFLCGTREGDIVKVLDFGSVKDTASTNQKKLTVLGTTIGSPYYMAPEQAQGLETIDSRADVFALAAVVYECITGEVPFGGTNGPSILLAILTKDPDPPTSKAAKAKYPIPPSMDEVMEVALTKNPAIRTKSVGALADAVGAAYGLTGDHRQWALVPQQDLAATIAAAMPRLMAAKVAPLGVAGDPFAAAPGHVVGDPFAASTRSVDDMAIGQADNRGIAPAPDSSDFRTAGVPAGKPGWMLPVIVGVLALLVGGAVTLFVMMGR